MMGRPPFRALLTHGFMVNKEGRKLSKSQGDSVDQLFSDYGADVIRWWVSSLAYENDVKVDRQFFDEAGESYRKVRNTIRFMLSNLDDFTPGSVDLAGAAPASLEAWLLGELDSLSAAVAGAYEAYQFRLAHEALYGFCNQTLSAVYLAAVKDRLYCSRMDDPRRRLTQAVLHRVTDQLCRLLAPLLPHTADEAWRTLVRASDDSASVHLQSLLPATGVATDAAWPDVMRTREAAQLRLEQAKSSGLDNPLDAGVVWPGSADGFDPVDLADLLGVSRVRFEGSAADPSVEDLRGLSRCERDWKRGTDVRARSDGGTLCDHCAGALGV
jgi:isoleucyl-tRNA synthetase